MKTPADFNQIASIVYYRSGPIAVIGFLAFVILMFWSCCRTCKCCYCHSQQPRREDENANKWTPRIFTFLMLCLFGATAGLMLNGFSVLDQQKDTLQNIPNLMDNLISYVDTSINCSNEFRAELNVGFYCIVRLAKILFFFLVAIIYVFSQTVSFRLSRPPRCR